MESQPRRPGLVGPLFLITVGVLLLLNQTGRLPWSIWITLWRFWPVLLILFGLEIFASATRSFAVYVLSLVVAVLVLGGTTFYAVTRYQAADAQWTPSSSESFREPATGVERGIVQLGFGAGDLRVDAAAEGADLVQGSIEYGRYSQPAERSLRTTAGTARFSLDARRPTIPVSIPDSSASDRWQISLTRQVPLDLEVRAGVGSVNVNMERLLCRSGSIDVGVGDALVTLPATAGTSSVEVSFGVGNVRVHVPEGVGARVQINRALVTTDVDPRFSLIDGEYVTADYRTAPNRVEVTIRGAIGRITLD